MAPSLCGEWKDFVVPKLLGFFWEGEARLSKYDRSNEEEPKRKWRKWVRGMKLPRKTFNLTSLLNLKTSPKDGSQERKKRKKKRKKKNRGPDLEGRGGYSQYNSSNSFLPLEIFLIACQRKVRNFYTLPTTSL